MSIRRGTQAVVRVYRGASEVIREYRGQLLTYEQNTEKNPTKVILSMSANASQTLYFTQSGGGVTIDWGDGSQPELITDVSATVSHTYTDAGEYTVLLTAGTGVTWTPGIEVTIVGNNDITHTDYGFVTTGAYIFNNTLIAVVAGDGMILTRNKAFYGSNRLKSITIPSGTTSIPDYAFYGCQALSSVLGTESVSSVGISGFYNCKAFDFTALASQLSQIGNSAFGNCTKSDSYLELKAESIGYNAFNGCKQLRRIWLRSSVTTMAVNTVRNNQQTITAYNGPFYGCSNSLVLYAECAEANKPAGWAAHFNCFSGTANELIVIWAQAETPRVSLDMVWDALAGSTMTYKDARNEGVGYEFDAENQTITIY